MVKPCSAWAGKGNTVEFRDDKHCALAEGAAYRGGHLVDGRAALSAAAVRLSLRGGAGIEAVRDVQGHGAAVAAADHEPGHAGGVGDGAAAGLADGDDARPLAGGEIP